MLYHIGFACRQETDNLRVGPYCKSENITASDVQQMDRYMMRVWVEMQIHLASYLSMFGGLLSPFQCIADKQASSAPVCSQ
jgi:hypothetical protein